MTNHVYLVDDDEAVRNALTFLLETVGLDVRSFASPEIMSIWSMTMKPSATP